MNLRRVLAVAAASVALVTSLTACFALPGLPNSGNGNGGNGSVDDGSDLVGTTWNGVDSDGDSWGMTFQEDGTIGLEISSGSYDDDTDVWVVDGGQISIDIALSDGVCAFVGDYDGADSPIELDGTYNGQAFTLTLERE